MFLVRRLGPEGYGVLALALGVASVLLVPTDFGLSGSVARFVAEARGDLGRVTAVLLRALQLKLLTAGTASVVLVACADLIARAYDAPELAWPLRLVALALLGQSVMAMISSCFVAAGSVRTNFRVVLSESSVEAGVTVALVLLGFGALGAAAGRAAGYVLAALLALFLILRGIPRRLLARSSGPAEPSGLVRYAGALFVVDVAVTLYYYLDVLLIGALLGTVAVGLFEAPLRMMKVLEYPGLALAAGLAPRLAGARTAHELRAFARGLRYLITLQFAMLAPLVVWAEPLVLTVLGPDYAASVPVVRAMSAYVVFAGLGALVSLGVMYSGEARRRIPVAIGALLVNLVIDLTLIPRIGIVAGAIGTSVAYGLYLGGHLWIARGVLGLALGPLVRTAGVSFLAAGLMGAVLLAFGTSNVGPGALVLGLAGGTAAYLVVLVAGGALGRQDLAGLRGLVGGRLR